MTSAKKCIKFDLKGNIVKRYDSISNAAKDNNMEIYYLSKKCDSIEPINGFYYLRETKEVVKLMEWFSNECYYNEKDFANQA